MWRSSGGRGGSTFAPRGAAAALTCLSLTLVVIVGQREPRAAGSAGGGGAVLSVYVGRLARERRQVSGTARSGAPPSPVERLSRADVFIAVKTTDRYHHPRLELLLDTWISENLPQTYVFTDGENKKLRERMGAHLINTNCSAAHNRQALSCKMALEYDTFMKSGKKWFCHVDDDNYLNVRPLLELLSQFSHTKDVYIGRPSLERPIEAAESLSDTDIKQVRFWFATGGAGFCLSQGLALKMKPWASDGAFMATAESIRLPDDCTVGYIVGALLGVGLTRSALFHSHLENLGLVSDIHRQVTLSYSTAENSRNTVNVKGPPFSAEEDPTRFRSVHCVLYPDTRWCPGALHQPPSPRSSREGPTDRENKRLFRDFTAST